MDIVKQTIETYDKIASSYCLKTRQKKYLDWEEMYIKKLLGYVDSQNPDILDVGCGDGRHCKLIDKNDGLAVGIDLSDNMLAEARNYYPGGNFLKMDMTKLEFEDNSFDGVWSSGSIYHVAKEHVRQVFSEIRRVLKNNGVIALSYKLGGGEGMESNPKSYGGSPRYFAYYAKDEMDGILQSCGFVELEARMYPEEIFGDDIIQTWWRKVKYN